MVEKSFAYRLRARTAISSFEVIRPQKDHGSHTLLFCIALFFHHRDECWHAWIDR